LHIFQLFSPSGSWEGWLLLLSFLGLLFVVLLFNGLSLGIERLRLRILTDRVIQEELQSLTSNNIIVHLATKAVRGFHVFLFYIPVAGFLD